MLRLTLRIDDVPLANQPYTFYIDGRVIENVTDAEGKFQQPIPPNARHGRLVVGAEKQWEFELDLGHIDPVENLAGVQKRLNNLGFSCGRTDGQWDDRCAEATREFQRQQGLTETGEPDDLTRQTLLRVHGS
jgi:type VI secretion system secreted protein VgrG